MSTWPVGLPNANNIEDLITGAFLYRQSQCFTLVSIKPNGTMTIPHNLIVTMMAIRLSPFDCDQPTGLSTPKEIKTADNNYSWYV